jgi:hypothetical protein
VAAGEKLSHKAAAAEMAHFQIKKTEEVQF